MTNNYKYGIDPKTLKEIRKYIIADIKSNNKVDNPIVNMTLQDYYDMVKECMLGLCDKNGKVPDLFPSILNYGFSKYDKDLREMSSVEVAKDWSDGRGNFTEHFNSQLFGDQKHYGDWENINPHEQNQWYHEDRLNDPLWFKECVSVIGHGGHPTELLFQGNFNPCNYEGEKWYMSFGMFSRGHTDCLKSYYYMKKKGLPVFIYNADMYLTPKQKEKLQKQGYLLKRDYNTGYGEEKEQLHFDW